MFSALRRRIHVSPATVIASLALVFAMTGGAYAAKKYLITSTKQISPSVLKSLQGKAGAAGVPGAAGAAGVQGPAGPAGPAGKDGASGTNGANGKDGAAGKDGATGKTGATGPAGKDGSPWTAGGSLPSEATETGSWWLIENGTETNVAPISFPIPLSKTAAEQIVVEYWKETAHASNCPGSVLEPKANPGFLCVYRAITTGINPEVFPPDFGVEEKIGTSGALIVHHALGAGGVRYGSFAVTAP